MADKRDTQAQNANEEGNMGPGATGGGFGHQKFDSGDREVMRGRQHMSGRHGDQAYGRADGVSTMTARDPSQVDVARTNAQVAGGAPTQLAGRENERDSPGISTDKHSDDTKP